MRLFITVMIWWMFCGDDDSGGHGRDGRDFDCGDVRCGGHGIVAFEVLVVLVVVVVIMVIVLVIFVAVEVVAVKMVIMVVVYNAGRCGCRDS